MIGSEHVPAQSVVQGLKPPAGATDPTGQRGTRQIDAVASEDLRLPIQRRVIAIFADEDLRDQRRRCAGPPAIRRSGAGACTTVSHTRQAYFGRVMQITRSCAGTQSSISDWLSPMA